MKSSVVALFLPLVASCIQGTHIVRADREAGVTSLAATLGYWDREPNRVQWVQFEKLAASECGGGDKYDVVVEGTDISSSPYYSRVGQYASAGTVESKSYYWVIRCKRDATATAVVATPGAQPDFSTAGAFADACFRVLHEDGDSPLRLTSGGYCFGFLDATVPAHNGEKWCVPSESRTVLGQTVLDYVLSHPSRRPEPPSAVVSDALAERYPCIKQQGAAPSSQP